MTSHAARLPGLDTLPACATGAVVACHVNRAPRKLHTPEAVGWFWQRRWLRTAPAAAVVPITTSAAAIQQRARPEGEATSAFIRRHGIKME